MVNTFKDGVKTVGGILDVFKSPRTICINKFIDCKFCQLTLPEQNDLMKILPQGLGLKPALAVTVQPRKFSISCAPFHLMNQQSGSLFTV
jgi:hypothetical protein